MSFNFHDTGAAMEVNISHQSRQAVLTTSNLAQPNLFNDALNELIQLMKMVGRNFLVPKLVYFFLTEWIDF